jgi:hypothetical protein
LGDVRVVGPPVHAVLTAAGVQVPLSDVPQLVEAAHIWAMAHPVPD